MKRFLFGSLLCCFFSCDDGNIQIETLDFDSFDIQTCEDVAIDIENVLFKINGDETLILELDANTLRNEVDIDTINVGDSGPARITYRIFSDDVTNDYFCDAIPPINPQVVEEIPAESGTVFIATSTQDSITFTHDISFSEISLITSENNRITDLTINDFGPVTTTVPEETDTTN